MKNVQTLVKNLRTFQLKQKSAKQTVTLLLSNRITSPFEDIVSDNILKKMTQSGALVLICIVRNDFNRNQNCSKFGIEIFLF